MFFSFQIDNYIVHSIRRNHNRKISINDNYACQISTLDVVKRNYKQLFGTCTDKIFRSNDKGSILIGHRDVFALGNLNLSQLENAINPPQKPFSQPSLKSKIIKSINIHTKNHANTGQVLQFALSG